METQLKILEIPLSERPQRLVIGGIYRDDNNDPDYDGCYALCMGNDQFFFIFNGITHIEEIVELACAHKMRLVNGYSLTIVFKENKWSWQIRNSAIKHDSKYILASGSCGSYFKESLKPFLKIFFK
jgi:hypothetical protein